MPEEPLTSVILRRRLTAAAVFVVVVVIMIALSVALPKKYQATSYLLVTSPQQQNVSAYEATQVSQALTSTFSQLLKTSSVSDSVRAALPPYARVSDPASAISIGTTATSVVITITATSGTPAGAQALANTYARVFVRHASGFAGGAGARAQFAEPATLPTGASSPRKALFALAGVLLGLVLGAGAALLRDRLDTRLRVAPEAVELLGLPILVRVPQLNTRDLAQLRDYSAEHLALLETYRLLLANLSFVSNGQRPRCVAVVSSSPQEGKSLTAISLARASSELATSTLLIDADLRRPEASRAFGSFLPDDTPGLARILIETVPDSADATLASAAVPVTVAPGLDLIPAGTPPPNPSVLLASAGLSLVAAAARRNYGFVVFDTPPLTVAADASHVAAVVDGVVLVVDAQRTRRNAAVRALDQLQRSGANVLGIVLNRASEQALEGYGPGYGYEYAEQTASERAEPKLDGSTSDASSMPRQDL
jgi:capsular exopolysaccharide synthesis family protein